MQTDQISKWAKSYGIEGVTVDGNNAQAVHEAAVEAAQSVRSTQKPFLLETYTYRMHGHMGIDDQKHIDPKELADWGAKDPIEQMKNALGISADEFAEIENRVKQTMDAAAQFAADSPYPDLSELTTDVYA
jgi:pyruvate dehydrogenase E1 component alpha subunit